RDRRGGSGERRGSSSRSSPPPAVRCPHLARDFPPRLLAMRLKRLAIAVRRVGRQVLEDSVATELATGVGPHDERVGLDLARALARDVALHVVAPVILVARIGEITTAAGLQVVDPGEV